MERLGVSSTARASFGVYNDDEDIERLASGLRSILERAHLSRRATPTAIVSDASGPEAQPVTYPEAVGTDPAAVAADIQDLFDALPDWPMRYQQLIELGEALPPMPANLKTEANFVAGCQSQVHMAARLRPGSDDIIEFLADSDADIVRGLIALLQQLFSGQRAADILAFDATAFFGQLGLDQHLSLTRRNGLAAMVQRLRQLARHHTTAHEAS
jgi:cysteine desulfurase/selenocysteine lyase